MPYLSFAGDNDHELASVFAAEAVARGAYIHPRHNWFVSAAMTGTEVALVLAATDEAFAAVRKHRIAQLSKEGQQCRAPPRPRARRRRYGLGRSMEASSPRPATSLSCAGR